MAVTRRAASAANAMLPVSASARSVPGLRSRWEGLGGPEGVGLGVPGTHASSTPPGAGGRAHLQPLPAPPLPPERRPPRRLPALLLHGRHPAVCQLLLHPPPGKSQVALGGACCLPLPAAPRGRSGAQCSQVPAACKDSRPWAPILPVPAPSPATLTPVLRPSLGPHYCPLQPEPHVSPSSLMCPHPSASPPALSPAGPISCPGALRPCPRPPHACPMLD